MAKQRKLISSRIGTFREDSSAVQSHLAMAQSVIQRMSSNSAGAKAFCITLVSAILVLVAQEGKAVYALLALLPSVLFLFLDTYYLCLEQRFRQSYNAFIDLVHSARVTTTDLYAIVPAPNSLAAFFRALLSPSIWPFYLVLIGLIITAMLVVIGEPTVPNIKSP
jgi:hypothetical protein